MGVPVTRDIATGTVHQYRLPVEDSYARIHLVKQGIDLEFTVSDATGSELVRVADWRDREGWLTALLERDRAEEFLLEISAVSDTVPPGQYVIRLEELPELGPEAETRIEAERAITRADHTRYAHYLGSGGSREDALKHFESARMLWRRLELPHEEARTVFSMATIQQELGKMTDAHQSYTVALELWRRVNDERGIAATLNQMGLAAQDLGRQSEALEHLSEARAIRERLGDTYFLAQTANSMGLAYTSLGQSRIAMKYLSQALEAQQGEAEFRVPIEILSREEYFRTQLSSLQTGGDLLQAAIALNNLARVHSTLGEFGEALNYYQNFRFISEYLGNDEDVALATLNIGQVYFQMADHQQALDHLSRSLEYFSGPDASPYWHSLALDNLGKVQLQLGNYRRALDFFEKALALRPAADNPRGRADTLQRLGETYAALGDQVNAIAYYGQSLELRQTAIDRYREALTLDQMGVAQASLGQFDAAHNSHQKALGIHRETGNSRGETEALVNLGRFHSSQGQAAEAIDYLQEALLLSRRTSDRVWEAQSLFELAKAQATLGRTRESLNRLDEALSVVDSLRNDLISPELRASFFATQLEVHSFYISELMNLPQGEDQSPSREAFLVAERAKQRTLLDYLANTGTTAENTDIDLLKRREALRRQLDANEQERIWLANKPEMAGQLALVDKDIRDITADLESVEIRISGRRPPEDEFEETIVTAEQAVTLLGADTVLLAYALGQERSFVWIIGQNIYDVAILPPGPEIEVGVRKAFAGLRNNNPSDIGSERDQLTQLGRLLLGPVVEHLGDKRLAIVPDGALHYLPFGALGDPRSDSGRDPLAGSNEIVILPSASGLLGLRNRDMTPGDTEFRIAVLADPVFTADDPRLRSNNGDASVNAATEFARPSTGPGRSDFSRLPGSLREAEFIQELVEPGKALVLTGFEANRDQLINGSLDDYNVMHLATHGIVNPTHPGLSGVVMSAIDSEGRTQPSFVRALDLYYMQIGARLVVLSACETALGKEIRGEGLMGLTRSFFYAGANTVVSSLWKVPDRATAELMKHFYLEMLENGLAPAAALRAAQLKIRDERRWRDPYYWAAFVVQGDWM